MFYRAWKLLLNSGDAHDSWASQVSRELLEVLGVICSFREDIRLHSCIETCSHSSDIALPPLLVCNSMIGVCLQCVSSQLYSQFAPSILLDTAPFAPCNGFRMRNTDFNLNRVVWLSISRNFFAVEVASEKEGGHAWHGVSGCWRYFAI